MHFLNKILSTKASFHIIFWLSFYLLFFIAMFRFEDSNSALQISILLVTPLILPVYLHSLVFEKLFHKKKYYLYGVITAAIVLVFGYLNELFVVYFVEGNSETYFTIILFIAMFTGFKYLRIGTKQQFLLEKEEAMRISAEAGRLSAELDLLKSQVNPHFLFNTLNNIYSLILDNDKNAGDAVLKLSGLMRYLLESAKLKIVSLMEECRFIEDYIALEKIRLEDRCEVNFNVDGDISIQKIAPMLLIPFVENSFKHGIGVNAKQNFVHINLKTDKDSIFYSVENNIVQKKGNNKDRWSKTGIKNLKRRLELLYPDKHELIVIKNHDIYKVELRINVNE